jgi:hypothetical protein
VSTAALDRSKRLVRSLCKTLAGLYFKQLFTWQIVLNLCTNQRDDIFGVQAELEEYAKRGEKPPEELLIPVNAPQQARPLYWPTNWPEVALQLKPHEGTIDRAQAFSPLTSEALSQLMFSMRLFSFSVG